jgi:hypothetical protein
MVGALQVVRILDHNRANGVVEEPAGITTTPNNADTTSGGNLGTSTSTSATSSAVESTQATSRKRAEKDRETDE